MVWVWRHAVEPAPATGPGCAGSVTMHTLVDDNLSAAFSTWKPYVYPEVPHCVVKPASPARLSLPSNPVCSKDLLSPYMLGLALDPPTVDTALLPPACSPDHLLPSDTSQRLFTNDQNETHFLSSCQVRPSWDSVLSPTVA